MQVFYSQKEEDFEHKHAHVHHPVRKALTGFEYVPETKICQYFLNQVSSYWQPAIKRTKVLYNGLK